MLPKSDYEWLKRHAERKQDGTYRCRETGAEIMCKKIARSIWVEPFAGGYGDVPYIDHLYCPKCNPDRSLPLPGAPIYENEVMAALD